MHETFSIPDLCMLEHIPMLDCLFILFFAFLNPCVYVSNTSIFKTYLGIRNTIPVFLSTSLDSYLQKCESALPS